MICRFVNVITIVVARPLMLRRIVYDTMQELEYKEEDDLQGQSAVRITLWVGCRFLYGELVILILHFCQSQATHQHFMKPSSQNPTLFIIQQGKGRVIEKPQPAPRPHNIVKGLRDSTKYLPTVWHKTRSRRPCHSSTLFLSFLFSFFWPLPESSLAYRSSPTCLGRVMRSSGHRRGHDGRFHNNSLLGT